MDRAEQVAREIGGEALVRFMDQVEADLSAKWGYSGKWRDHEFSETTQEGRVIRAFATALRASQPQWRTDMENAPKNLPVWLAVRVSQTGEIILEKAYFSPSAEAWCFSNVSRKGTPIAWLPLDAFPPPPVQETEQG